MAELCTCWRRPRATVVREGHCCACPVCSAICVHRLCCLDRAHTESSHLIRDIEIRSEPPYVAVSSPSVVSSVARLRVGVASTSVLAKDGCARWWSRRWGKDVGDR